jgi:hypothetical protein
MAVPPNKNKAANADDADLQIPIQKTSPLVFVGIGVVVLAIGGVAAFSLFGKSDKNPPTDIEAAVNSARVSAAEAKAKQKAQEEHLELAAKAWAIASEKEKVAAAASAAAAAAAAEEAEAKTGGGRPSGGGAPPKPKAGKSELDELDKLGSAVNSELGGP